MALHSQRSSQEKKNPTGNLDVSTLRAMDYINQICLPPEDTSWQQEYWAWDKHILFPKTQADVFKKGHGRLGKHSC